jgi:hypothetical protein
MTDWLIDCDDPAGISTLASVCMSKYNACATLGCGAVTDAPALVMMPEMPCGKCFPQARWGVRGRPEGRRFDWLDLNGTQSSEPCVGREEVVPN